VHIKTNIFSGFSGVLFFAVVMAPLTLPFKEPVKPSLVLQRFLSGYLWLTRSMAPLGSTQHHMTKISVVPLPLQANEPLLVLFSTICFRV